MIKINYVENLIIGSGITGLSSASFIKNKNYLIIEKDSEVGGYCKTIKKDGFTWDYSGHFFHFKDDGIKNYLLKNMVEKDIVDINKKSQIYLNGIYVDFPFQKNIHQLHQQDFIDCLYDLFNVSKFDIISFKDMIINKFGASICRLFLIPYNEKLYACNLDHLDKDAMGRFFPMADKYEIIKNFKIKNNESYNNKFTYPIGGAIEYVNSLLSYVDKSKILFNQKIKSINMETKTAITLNGEIKFKRLISTIPLPSLLELLNYKYDEDTFSSNKVLVFNLGFNKKGGDKINHWVYFPENDIRFYRVGYYDNIFGDNRMSLYVEIGFDKKEIINVNNELERVMADLVKVGVVSTDQKLISHHSVIMDPAYVHLSKKSNNETIKIKDALKMHDIYSIGRYGSWTYCSIEDNIIEASELIKKIT